MAKHLSSTHPTLFKELKEQRTPVKEPNSENVDISSGGGVTGWKSKCCS